MIYVGRLIGFDSKMRNLKNIKLDINVRYSPIFFDIETLGLNASEDKWIAYGQKIYGKDEEVIFNTDEFKLAKKVRETTMNLKSMPNPVIIGFHSANFDLPFIIARSTANGVNMLHLKYIKHIDMMLVLQKYLFSNRFSMDILLKRMGIPNEDKYKGKDVIWLYDIGRYSEIVEHCKYDLKKLETVYNNMKTLIDIEYFWKWGETS